MKEMTYAGVGVQYDKMDPFKLAAQAAARETDDNLAGTGFEVVPWTRGESVTLVKGPGFYFGLLEEGLGTKNLVADAVGSGRTYYERIAQDTFAMIVNDLATLGVAPMAVAMHLAVGSSTWFENQQRCEDLIAGWKLCCGAAKCAWVGGETPTLRDVVCDGTAVISGSAVGFVMGGELPIKRDIQERDIIVLLSGTGIHANGLTLARDIAAKLPEGYQTTVAGSQKYGEALLTPTPIYTPVIRDCLQEGVKIHYAINITGHGWRKLMRAPEPFVYRITRIPPPQPVFSFMQEHGPVTDEEAYGNLNMGAGFALIAPDRMLEPIAKVAINHGFHCTQAGRVEKRGDVRKVAIEPLGLEFDGSTLDVR